MPSPNNAIGWSTSIGCVLLMTVFLLSLAGVAEANGKHHRKRSHYNGNERNSEKLAPVVNQAYREQCGGCHFAYQPGLLPAGSWQKIMAGLKEHFGEDLGLSPEENKALTTYLTGNAADASNCKISQKIMKSLAGQTPVRISQVPYIIHKHQDDDIPADAFSRKSVGSLGNCVACHTRAEQGDYDDDYVRIPK